MKKTKQIRYLAIILTLLITSIETKANVISFCGKKKIKEVIVIGSMHSVTERNQPKKEIISAIKSSDHVMLEADVSAIGIEKYLEMVDNIDNIKLSSKNLETMVDFFNRNENLKVYNIILEKTPSHVISNLIPLATNNLPNTSQKWSYDAVTRAEADKSMIHISFLEDAKSTLDMWKNIGEENINTIIASQIEFYSNKEKSFNNDKQMMSAWEKGDEKQLQNFVLNQYPGKAKDIIRLFHSKREESMAEKINTATGSKIFVVVGAYHVNKIRNLLKDNGYKSFDCEF